MREFLQLIPQCMNIKSRMRNMGTLFNTKQVASRVLLIDVYIISYNQLHTARSNINIV